MKNSSDDHMTLNHGSIMFPDDTPMTEETVLSMSSSLVGLTPGKYLFFLVNLY